jgi:hypothetical protein
VCPRIVPCFSLDFLGIGLFGESRQLRAELWKMIKQLRVRKIVRSGNIRVLIDCGNPRLKNLLPTSENKVAKSGDCSGRKLALTVSSDGRNPPSLISEVNTRVALG